MTRITDPMDWCDLDRLASDIRGKLVYRRARCQHGYTRSESCRQCENGYSDDHHAFAAGIGHVAEWNDQTCWAVSDDGEDVAYLPAKYQARIYREEPIEVLKRASRPGSNESTLIAIQRIIGRLRSYHDIEMQSNIVHVGVPAGSVDSAAWADIKGLTPAQAKPAVRFLGDGSAVTCHYGPNGLPQYRRFFRS